MWLSHTPLRQFGGALKPDIIRKIEKKDIPWERYYDLSPQDLGEPLQLPKLGKKLHRLIHQFPKVIVGFWHRFPLIAVVCMLNLFALVA